MQENFEFWSGLDHFQLNFFLNFPIFFLDFADFWEFLTDFFLPPPLKPQIPHGPPLSLSIRNPDKIGFPKPTAINRF